MERQSEICTVEKRYIKIQSKGKIDIETMKKKGQKVRETMVKEIYRETDTGIDGQRNKRKRSREIQI